MADLAEYKKIIDEAWDNRELLKNQDVVDAIFDVVALIDKGEVRVSEPVGNEFAA